MASLSPYINAASALLLGILVGQFVGHPYLKLNHKATQLLLQYSIVGLGFGMNLNTALQAGKDGFLITFVFILIALLLGVFLAPLFKIPKVVANLIAVGTSICGGSAIAAVSGVLKANENEISLSLVCIFLLNALALFVFPAIGFYTHMSENDFGLWCAVAIHDTSTVVATAAKFGDKALEIATTVKLARVLWIIPIALLFSYLNHNQQAKIKIPYFILFFVLAIFMNSYLTDISFCSTYIVKIAKAGLVLALFLIGSGLNREVLKKVGVRPLAYAFILWVLMSFLSWFFIMFFN